MEAPQPNRDEVICGGTGRAQGFCAARVRAVAMALGSRMSVAGTSAAVAMGAMYSSRFMESIFSVSDSLRQGSTRSLLQTSSTSQPGFNAGSIFLAYRPALTGRITRWRRWREAEFILHGGAAQRH